MNNSEFQPLSGPPPRPQKILGRKPRSKKTIPEINQNNNKPKIKTPPILNSVITEKSIKNENIIIENSKAKTLESNYIPYISFNNLEQQEKANEYIVKQVKEFLNFLQKDFENFSYLDYSKSITDLDFSGSQRKPIDYFYNYLLIDLVKRGRDENGKLISPKKWTVTFDINCTPIKVSELIIPNSGNLCRHFGTIDVGGTPILYYIYFTMQEILDAIRDNE